MAFLFTFWFIELRWIDLVDIGLVALLLFQLYKLLKGSVASKILIGFLFFYLLYLVVKVSKMELLGAIMEQFAGVGIIAAIVLFQQEIRRFLLMIGKNTTFNTEYLKSWKRIDLDNKTDFVTVIDAVKTLSATGTGALIVFAKSAELKFYQESGDIIDALICKRLLISIFNKNSPLHDGAVIIHRGRIKAARCILPISENEDLPAYYGMRHRAALGMSEVTDAVVLIVSEETGQISVAHDGKLYHNLSPLEVLRKLNQMLKDEVSSTKIKSHAISDA
jgi:diadenylate cyclase